MSTITKFGLGSMINNAMKFMVQNCRDMKCWIGTSKSQGMNRYIKSLHTGGKKILKHFGFFGKSIVPIRTGFQAVAPDSRGGGGYIQNGIVFSYACGCIVSSFCRKVCAKFSRPFLSAILGVLIALNFHTFANAACEPSTANDGSLHSVSGSTAIVVNSTDTYTPYKFRYQINEHATNTTEYEIRYQVSERINDGNWTDSAIVRGNAARSHVGAPINADALAISLANGHGTWYVTGPSHVTGESVNWKEWQKELNNQRVTFVPNNLSAKITNDDIVEVRIRLATWSYSTFWHRWDYDYQCVTLSNYNSTALSWEEDNDPHIVPDGTSTYGELDGLVTNSPTISFPLKFGGYEQKPDGSKTPADVGATREITSKFSGWDVPVGDNFKYGSWVISRHHDKFLFRPKSVEINKLGPGQTVFSALEVTAIDGNGDPLGDKQTIKVVIGKSQIAVYWDNGTDFADSGNSGITTAEIPDTSTNITGSIETDFNQLLRGGQATSLNKWRFSLFEDTTPETDNDVPPVDEAILNNPNRKWNTDIVTFGVEEVTELVGKETRVGDATSSGTWYIREADGYTGTNYLAHTSTRQFLFRPNPDVLRVGSSVVSYLRIQKGWCNVINFPRNTDCPLHTSEFDGEINSAVIIAAKVSRDGLVNVSINDIALKEGDGSGSTEFRFKVSLDSKAGAAHAFTVPVAFRHVSTGVEDFMVGENLTSRVVTFNPGVTEQTIPIMVKKDEAKESDDTFELRLSEPTGEAVNKGFVQLVDELGAGVGTGTIIDDDRWEVSINDVPLEEGTGEAGGTEFQFTVRLSPATAVNQTFTVPITFNHVGTNTGDFVNDPELATFDVNFGATDTSRDLSVILVTQDSDGEENERFTLTLSEPTGDAKTMNLVTLSRIPGATVGTGTINDDDAKDITLSWLAGFDGTIVGDGSSDQYGYKVALVTDDTTTPDRYAATEMKNEDVINRRVILGHLPTASINRTLYPEFTGSGQTIFGIDSGFVYGHWYVRNNNTSSCGKRYCEHVLFVPNARAINQLNPSDIVKSTFVYSLYSGHSSNPTIVAVSSLTVTISVDFGSNQIGFNYDSRSIIVTESENETAELGVFITEAMDSSIDISYRVSGETAEFASDFMLPPTTTVTIPATQTSGTISIPINDDSIYEDSEEFTVHLIDGADFEITPAIQSATVTILDDDPISISDLEGGACGAVIQPSGVTTLNTVAYWKITPATISEPRVYYAAGERFDATIGFRSAVNVATEVYFGSFTDDGTAENAGLFVEPAVGSTEENYTFGTPGSHRGYFRYRILPRSAKNAENEWNNNEWYNIDTDCEFYVWWTDANKPGITLSVTETVKEGRPFRVIATATPRPNRDILVPVSLSVDPRIAGDRSFNVRIKAGQASGYMDVPTNFMPGDQPSDNVTATVVWRSAYWLDDNKKSATVTLEDHDQRFVSFKNSDPDIEVVESETAELAVSFTGTNSSGVTVKYRIDDVDTDSMDYTATANQELTIATGNEGTISIPISTDMEFEDSESFTVTLIESADALPGNSNNVATVTIISDDGASPSLPRGEMCDDVVQPQTTNTVNTQAFWEKPFPDIYQETNSDFTAVMKFRDPVTGMEGDMKLVTAFKIAIYYLNGSVENAGIEMTPTNVTDRLDFPLKSPKDYTGYLGYRIEKSNLTNDEWYDIAEPCEFPIWWTDANKPGIKIDVDKKIVAEGSSFRVTATATPEPNRDILVPISVSETSRIDGSTDFAIRIAAGQPSGHIDILTRVVTGEQPDEDLTVSAEWRSTYWMDETVRSKNITLTEPTFDTTGVTMTKGETTDTTLKLSFTGISSGGACIKLNVAQGNDLITGVVSTATAASGGTSSSESTYTVLTLDDTQNQPIITVTVGSNTTGTVEITLESNSDTSCHATLGEAYLAAANQTVTHTFSSASVPTISISNPPTSITESEGAELIFNFMLNTPSNEDVTISTAVTSASTVEAEDYTLANPKLTISGGTTGSISMQISNDAKYEGDETIVVEFTATNAVFGPNTATRSLTVTIRDDESKPEIEFSSATLDVNEGEMIKLTLVASVDSETDPVVAFTPTSFLGNFLDTTAGASGASRSETVDFQFNDASQLFEQTLSIALNPINELDEEDGVITVALDTPASTDSYTVGDTTNTVTVTVADAGEVSIPTITVTEPSSTVSEAGGPTLTYDFDLSKSASGNVLISHSVSKDSTAKPADYMLSNIAFNGLAATLTVKVEDDDVYEGDETIVLTLTSTNAVFSDGTNTHELTVMITDDEELPTLSVKDVTQSVPEGVSATVRVKSTVETERPVQVGFTATNVAGQFLDLVTSDPNPVSMKFKKEGSEFIGKLMIGTRKSNVAGEVAGVISFTLATPKSTAGYEIDSRAATATFVVTDVSNFLISIRPQNQSVVEGEDIVVTFQSDPEPTEELEVGFRITQTGDNLVWPVKRKVSLSRTSKTVSLTLNTIGNPESAVSGMVSVEVLPGSGYTPGNPATVEVRKPEPVATAPAKYSVVSSVITEILTSIPPTPPQGESSGAKPTLSIRAVNGIVDEGESAVFEISASHAVKSGIPAKIKLSQTGDFIVGPIDRTVNLQTEFSETEFAVATDNDDLAEVDGRITATILIDSEYHVGSQNTAHVIVSDVFDRRHRQTSVATALHSVLPELLAHSTAGTLEIADNRITQGFSGSTSTSIELNGRSPALIALQSGGEMLNGNSIDWQSLIDDSSFTLALYPEGGETSPATVWGVGDTWNLANGGNGAQRYWDSESHTGHFGFDMRVGPGMLAGLAMSVSQSDISYGPTGSSKMLFESITTGVHPFLGISNPNGSFRMQVIAGYGESELELKQNQHSPEMLNGNFHSFGFAGSNRLYSNSSFSELQNLELYVASKAWHSRQYVDSVADVTDSLQVEARHFQIAIEEAHEHHLGSGGIITPSLSIGLRGDGRNEQTAFGLNLGSGIKYAGSNGLEISGSAQSMLAGLNRLRRWEIAGTVDYDSENDGKGLLFSISPLWRGIDSAVVNHIWESQLTGVASDSFDSAASQEFAAEIGYGLDVLDGSAVATPFHALKQTGDNGIELRLGSRIATNNGVSFELEIERDIPETGVAAHELNLTGNINW